MRPISHLVVHCSATAQTATVEAIKRYWRENLGWRAMGYHKIIEANGTIHTLAEDAFITNGVKGHNTSTLHVCYIGGVRNGKAADTRTDAQKASLLHVLKEWRAKYPNAKIQGHRDFPGVKKECPSFNAINEYKDI